VSGSLKPIVVWGAAGQARVLCDFLGDAGFEPIAFFDNDIAARSPLPGVPIHHGQDGFREWRGHQNLDGVAFTVAIGGERGSERIELHAMLERAGLRSTILVHPAAYVARDASLGAGTQVLAGAVVGAAAHLGIACIVNTAASVDHECELGDGTHIGPGAVLAGCVRTGEHVFVGAGAVVVPRIAIGAGAIIGAGAVVLSDVLPNQRVSGVPARPHRQATP
jgi:sugar O-acyltransferase (sialic acid O-acetyltransferase NeuD family)